MAIESHMVHRLTIITLQKYSVMGLSRLALIPRWRSFCFSAFFLAPVFFFGILYQVKFSYVFSFIWTKSWPTRLRCNKPPGDSKGECEVWGWIKKPLTENRNKKGYNLVPSLLAFWSGHEIGQKKMGVFLLFFLIIFNQNVLRIWICSCEWVKNMDITWDLLWMKSVIIIIIVINLYCI